MTDSNQSIFHHVAGRLRSPPLSCYSKYVKFNGAYSSSRPRVCENYLIVSNFGTAMRELMDQPLRLVGSPHFFGLREIIGWVIPISCFRK
jgi:hypothetical protein